MIILIVFTAICFLMSLVANRAKTLMALKLAWKKFTQILPAFLEMLIIVSVLLFFLPPEIIQKYLGNSNVFLASILGLVAGSVTMMPGFIVFPLSDILIKQGVTYTVIAMFTTALMMVGAATFPIERKFLGVRVAIIRNIVGLITAIIVSIVIGLSYGEIHL